jgi:hypothetical protein
MFLATLREAVHGGLDGPARDEVLERTPRGFDLGDVDVRLAHGGLDPDIPLRHAEHVARTLPSCRPTFTPTTDTDASSRAGERS